MDPIHFICVCGFEAASARHLSRHKTVAHNENTLKCKLCPFVTVYQTNLLRHRREVHGILGPRGNKTCKFCGFASVDSEILIQHQRDAHGEILKSAQEKFAKEAASAVGDESFPVNNSSSPVNNSPSSSISGNDSVQRTPSHHRDEGETIAERQRVMIDPSMLEDAMEEDEDEFLDWKEGFMDAPVPNLLASSSFYESLPPTPSNSNSKKRQRKSANADFTSSSFNSYDLSSPASAANSGGEYSSRPTTPVGGKGAGLAVDTSGLAPTRIRRQYTCEQCSFRTINPREFLYHRRDVHGAKVKIVECPYCVYACQYFQKLQRHILLVHKLETSTTRPRATGSNPSRSIKNQSLLQRSSAGAQLHPQRATPAAASSAPIKPRPSPAPSSSTGKPRLLQSLPQQQPRVAAPQVVLQSAQRYREEAGEEKEDLEDLYAAGVEARSEHEPTEDEDGEHENGADEEEGADDDGANFVEQGVVNPACKTDFTKKYFKCDSCGYTTNVQYLFKKHVKYHSAPKIKCEKCDFESPYSWNVERHARSHASHGAFSCSKCTFACDTPQALTVHITKHHRDSGQPEPSPTPSMQNEDESSNQEEMVVTPDISFAFVPNGVPAPQYDPDTNMFYSQPGLQPNVPYESPAAAAASKPHQAHAEPTAKLLHCAYCSFTHKESKSMVSHMSVHTGKKPYRCRHCGFSSNWKEVVARHAKSRHDGSNLDVDQLFKYTVSKFICRVVDETGELNVGPEVTRLEDIIRPKAVSNTPRPSPAPKALADHHSMVTPGAAEDPLDNRLIDASGQEVASRLSGLRGSFKCEICPFRAEKAFHIDFHMKRHQEGRGVDFKCPHCPYWVNAKKSLVKHVYLHEYEKGNLTMQTGHEPVDDEEFEVDLGEGSSGQPVSILQQHLRQPNNYNQQQSSQQQQLLSQLSKRARMTGSAKNRCDGCPFIAGTKTQLLYHKQFHRPNRVAPYKCSLCSYAVSHQHLLNQHFKVHNNDADNTEIPYVTYQTPDKIGDMSDEPSESDRDESSEIAFSVVDNGNGKQRVYHCRYCPTSSKRKTYIYVHEQMHNMNSEESFKCSSCDYATPNSTLFLAHLSTHTDKSDSSESKTVALVPNVSTKRSFQETLPAPKEVVAPRPVHPGSHIVDSASIKFGNRRMFSYVCPSCPAAFKSPGDLKIHAVFHGDVDYPHSCPYCNYRAKNKPQLCKHLYVHTADYISKRANSYPDGTKLTIGDGITQQRKELSMPSRPTPNNSQVPPIKPKQGAFLPAPPPLYRPQQAARSTPDKPVNSRPQVMSTPTFDPNDNFEEVDEDDAEQSFVDIDEFLDDSEPGSKPSSNRFHTQQLCILESSETKEFLEKLRQKSKHRFIHRCPTCPAAFLKANTLKFHSSLHGYAGQMKCKNCSYSADFEDNIKYHQILHANSALASSSAVYTYNHRCSKCPAAFSKPSRLEKHITLHGSNAKWKCDKCDYAVPYAATLVKHKHVHDNDNISFEGASAFAILDLPATSNASSSDSRPSTPNNPLFKTPKVPNGSSPSHSASFKSTLPLVPLLSRRPQSLLSNTVTEVPSGGKTFFCCPRCPYSHARRDAVQSHLKRHAPDRRNRDGKKCPHCDYVCLQPSYLREHIRLHYEPPNDRKPDIFRKYVDIEVWKWRVPNEGEPAQPEPVDKELLFKDLGLTFNLRERFEPHEEDEELYAIYDGLKESETGEDVVEADDEDEIASVDAVPTDGETEADHEDLLPSTSSVADDAESCLESEVESEQPADDLQIDEDADCELMIEEQEVEESLEEPIDFDTLEDVVEPVENAVDEEVE